MRAGAAFVLLFGLAAGFVAGHVGTLAGLVAYVGACGVCALLLPPGYAALTGLSGWAFLTGFVVNTAGRLTFAVPDLERLALLVALSIAVSAVRPRHGSRV